MRRRPQVKSLTTSRAVTSVRALHMRWPRDKVFPAPTHSARRFHFFLQPLFGGASERLMHRPGELRWAGMQPAISAVTELWGRPPRAVRKGSPGFSGGVLAVRKRSFGSSDQHLTNRTMSFRPGRTPLPERKDPPCFSREPLSERKDPPCFSPKPLTVLKVPPCFSRKPLTVLKMPHCYRNVRLTVTLIPLSPVVYCILHQKALPRLKTGP